MDNLHLHHRFFSFICCLWCYQKQFVIRMLFFIALGIFIQGSLVYPYTELIDSYESKIIMYTNTSDISDISDTSDISDISDISDTSDISDISDTKIKEVIIYKCDFSFEDICEICFTYHK